MLKFPMNCFDVLFPINLGPLTYKCPEGLAEKAEPGMIVSAPLRNKLTEGIILRKNTSPPAGSLKEISVIKGDSPVLSKGLLKLLIWMADYYISNEGLILKQTMPKELFAETKARRSKKEIPQDKIELIDINEQDISPVSASVQESRYSAFLLHAPSLQYEFSFALSLLKTTENIIVLLPEVSQADLVFSSFKEFFNDRICLLHSEISKGRRSEYVRGIISGKHDIVIGTRHALFAPLKKVQLIIVLNEHSSSYKLEEGIRYNIRDTAVMRSFIEKATVLLSSITPSSDSYYNTLTKKYHLLKPETQIKQPFIKIVNMMFEKKIKPFISKTVYEASKKFIKQEKKVVFVVNRRGHSSMLLCRACEYIEKCRTCNIPLVHHKNSNDLICHYCGRNSKIPEKCPKCGAFELEMLGAGTEKIQEELEELFGIKTLRLDSDTAKKGSDSDKLLHDISSGSSKVIIGTKMVTKRITSAHSFFMAAVLSIDSSMNLPDFRSPEKTYMELTSLMELVEPQGEIIIQTRFPQNPIFRFLKNNQYLSFLKEELATRKALEYPPYSKLLKIRFAGNADTADKMIKTINSLNMNIEVLGPVVSRDKKGREEYSLMLKSTDKKLLNTAARTIMSKKTEDMNIYLDVDPY